MTHVAPVEAQDKPIEPDYRALCDAMGWPPIQGGSPELDEGGEEEGVPTPEAPEDSGQAEPEEGEESFYDFDPSQVPENADRDWLADQYGEMRKAFTQKTQGIAETRREAEESQALIEGLRDPSTMPHYLRLMGIDLNDPEALKQLGIDAGEADDELRDLLDDEPELEDRVGQLEQERAAERQQREADEMEAALDELADQELENIEEAWGRELDPDEDAFIRHRAEASPGPDGLPDYEAAAKVLKGWLTRREKEWAKQRSEPGRGQPGGKPGGKALDPTKDDDRLQLGAAAAERAMASQQ